MRLAPYKLKSIPYLAMLLIFTLLIFSDSPTLTSGDLSKHPELKNIPPNFFLQDKDFKEKCSLFIEAFEEYNECEENQFIVEHSCAEESMKSRELRKWCYSYIALYSNDLSWCDLLPSGADSSLCILAYAKVNPDHTLCDKIIHQNSAMQCYSSVATNLKNPFVCAKINNWFEERAKRYDEDFSQMSKDLSEQNIRDCKSLLESF